MINKEAKLPDYMIDDGYMIDDYFIGINDFSPEERANDKIEVPLFGIELYKNDTLIEKFHHVDEFKEYIRDLKIEGLIK